MNAERLHVVAIALRKEFAELEIVQILQQLRESLERSIQNPQQQQFQQQVSDRLAGLKKRLPKRPATLSVLRGVRSLRSLGPPASWVTR
jgi:hypothetical protein